MNEDNLESEDGPKERPNKSQIKREMNALKEEADKLLHLKKTQIDSLEIDQALLDAIDEYSRIKKPNAQKRHLQYVTRLLSDQKNLEQILEKIHGFTQPHFSQRQTEKKLDQLLPELIEGKQDKIEELLALSENHDRQHLMQLIRNAQKEYKNAEALEADNKTSTTAENNNEEANTRNKKALSGKHVLRLKDYLRTLEKNKT